MYSVNIYIYAHQENIYCACTHINTMYTRHTAVSGHRDTTCTNLKYHNAYVRTHYSTDATLGWITVTLSSSSTADLLNSCQDSEILERKSRDIRRVLFQNMICAIPKRNGLAKSMPSSYIMFGKAFFTYVYMYIFMKNSFPET